MDDTDKLAAVIEKLSSAQIREVIRFAEFITHDEPPDDLHDQSDVRARYAEFKEFCQASEVDLDSIEAWVQETTSQLKPRGMNSSDATPGRS